MACFNYVLFLYCCSFVGGLSLRDEHGHDYEVVTPQRIPKRSSDKDVQYQIATQDNLFHISLKENKDISSPYLHFVTEDVNIKHNYQQCHYHGLLVNHNGDVIMNDCDGGLSGTIFVNNEDDVQTYHIKYEPEAKRHIFYKVQIDPDQPVACQENKRAASEQKDQQKRRMRRSNVNLEGVTKYVSLAIVVDNTFFKKQMKGSLMSTMNYVYSVVNHVDYIYRAVDIRVALTNLELWTDKDKFNVTTETPYNLRSFEEYNRNVLKNKYKWEHDNAQMLIGIKQSQGYTGLGAVGSLCYGDSAAVSYTWSTNPAITAGTLAHELGHNMGAHHFKGSCNCTRKPCMMTPTASWSPVNGLTDCTVKTINQRCNKGWCLCLLDKPTKIEGGPVCGNGFVEKGEECDCGQPRYCKNPCCDPYTCKMHSGAVCASGECCENCLPKLRGSICREKAGECDISERCDGNNGECPANSYLQDFKSCDSNKGFCHNGLCSESLTKQCQDLWGQNSYHGGVGSCKINSIYMNMRGSSWGNCGKVKTGYKQCRERDVNCGKLQCYGENLPKFIIFGSLRQTMYYHVNDGKRCVTGTTFLGKDSGDMTLVKTGTKCADNKVCYEQQCVPVTALKTSFQSDSCNGQCTDNGECTNTGRCYCQPGYQCPDCRKTNPLNMVGELCSKAPPNSGANAFSNTTRKKCNPECSMSGTCDGKTGTCFCLPGWKCPDCNGVDYSNSYGVLCPKENVVTTKPPNKKLQCSNPNFTLQTGSCFSKLEKPFEMIANYRHLVVWTNFEKSLKWIVCQCAALAKEKNYKVSAIQFWGECWASNEVPPYATIGVSERCKNTKYKTCAQGQEICTGDDYSSYIYEFV